jgi:hypothetical protein
VTRLKHTSLRPYVRYMQMSRNTVFAFVEGPTDPYFYAKVCEAVCAPAGIEFEVCTAEELPSGAGGKQALLVFFGFLRKRSLLHNDFKGKRTISVFFADKDIDDLARRLKRSDHLVYTAHYQIENHLVAHGDFIEAVAAAAAANPNWIHTNFGDPVAWRSTAAYKWIDWVKLCLFANLRGLGGDCNYGSLSQINRPLHGSVDQHEYTTRLAQLEVRSGLSSRQFKRAFQRLSSKVDRLYASGDHDLVFKGKWYWTMIEAELRHLAGTKRIHLNRVQDRLPSAFGITLDFDQPWAERFKRPLRQLISRL